MLLYSKLASTFFSPVYAHPYCINLSIHSPTCPSTCLFTCESVHPSTRLSFIHASIHQFIYPFIHPSIHLFINLFTLAFIHHLRVHPSIHPSTHSFISLSVRVLSIVQPFIYQPLYPSICSPSMCPSFPPLISPPSTHRPPPSLASTFSPALRFTAFRCRKPPH